MDKIKIFAHGSYIGTTGFNNHTRDFFRELSNYVEIKFRNFTVGSSWNGLSNNAHDSEPYLDDRDREILFQQTLWTSSDKREDFIIYPKSSKNFIHDFNIVLS